MRRMILISVMVVGGLLAQAPKAPAAAPKKTAAPAKPAAAASPMAKIVQMVEMKLPDAAILNAIKSAGALNPTADDFIKLKQLGASDHVIVALTGGTPAAPASAPAVSSAPGTVANVGGSGMSLSADFSSLGCTKPVNSAKRVLAIDEFDYGTVKSAVAGIFGTQVDIGKGILALLTKRLAENGQYRIVERKNLQKVLSEQDLGASSRVKQGTNAKIGRVQGADAILMGTITVFGNDSKRRGVDAGGLGGFGSVLGGGRVSVGSDKAVVEISYRLVDAETSEVIAVGEARGESQRKSVGLGGLGYGGGKGGYGNVDMTSANFEQTIIGEATVACINKLAAIANQNAGKVGEKSTDAEVKIADISGGKVYLAGGSNDGIQKCDRFEVSRIIKEIKDPSTGEVLDLQTEKIGELMVMEVRDKISIAVFNGSSEPKVGYVAKKL